MKLKAYVFMVAGVLAALPGRAQMDGQEVVTVDVAIPQGEPSEFVANVDHLADHSTYASRRMVVYEIAGSKRRRVPSQVLGSSMYWLVKSDGKEKSKRYEIVTETPTSEKPMAAVEEDGGIVLKSGSKNLLRYQVEMAYPPPGVDQAYKRNGFIHPLWTPHGQVLTRIQPKDHYHHYGIWNPWTHVLFKGDTVDFWNIGGKKGTVRVGGIQSTDSGPFFAAFSARHDHIVNRKDAQPEVAIREDFSVKTWKPEDAYYIIDIVSTLSATDEVVLLKYRYGGLGWRTTEVWDNKNSEVITSDGKSRKEADGSKARWCIVQGELGSDYGGAVMMSHPSNYNHPEPLRIWPENQYNRGDMFANFSPTKDMDWTLRPGQLYTLKYRFMVFNGKMTKEKAEQAWQDFAHPPLVTVVLKSSPR